jgi:hypothetical protein
MASSNPPQPTDALKRWSCGDQSVPLPIVGSVREVHIYDFDNTLFKTPLPSRKLWYSQLIGKFFEPRCFVGGGWWHDPGVLAACGGGVQIEEPRAWNGWWNEKVVELARLSIAQPDALSILLTGRGEARFADLVRRMVKSKGLDFDMTCLKPDPESNTMDFKRNLIRAVLHTYSSVEKLTIYEDRPKHVQQFSSFLDNVAREFSLDYPPRKFQSNVVKVPPAESSLDPGAEAAQVQRMINEHNAAIVAGTADEAAYPMTLTKIVYMVFFSIKPSDYKHLLGLLPPGVKSQAQYSGRIVVATSSIRDDEMAELGGVGNDTLFRATEIGSIDGDITAIRVQQIDASVKVRPRVGGKYPTVILSMRRDLRPTAIKDIKNWTSLPVDKQLQFRATLREHYRLNIQRQQANSNGEASRENAAPDYGQSVQKDQHSRRSSDAREPRESHSRQSNYTPRGSYGHNGHHNHLNATDYRHHSSPHRGPPPPRYQQQHHHPYPRGGGRGNFHHAAANGGPRGYSTAPRGGGGRGDRGDRGGYRNATPRGGMGRGGRGGYAPRGSGAARGGYRSLDDLGGAYTDARDTRDSYDY